MVSEMKKLGVDRTISRCRAYHTDVVVPNLPKVFEFLATKRRGASATQQ